MKSLYLIPTPIGDLRDMTYKSVEYLNQVDQILAEDTRVSKKLLDHYNINVPLKSYHQHNEHKLTSSLIEEMKDGKTYALITDAGMPGISDPAYLLVQACIKEKVPFEVLPGASAFLPALIYSGFPLDRFVFEGFLPHKKGRNKQLDQIKENLATTVLYESPYRIPRLINEIKEIIGEETELCICRELTKMHEECIYGTAEEISRHYLENKPRGEYVVVIKRK